MSIVVPTRGRPLALRRCLLSLARQSAAAELIVVDDSPGGEDEGLTALVAGAGGRLVRTGSAGPAAARNAGARQATGDVVCFTDDDCEPERRWAELLAEGCSQTGAAAGPTLCAVPGNVYDAASQALTNELMRRSLDPESGSLAFAPTSNLAVSRTVALRLPFDERFPAAAGEDRDWCARAGAAGHAPQLVPGARVHHRQELGLGGFWRQQLRYGRGAAAFASGGGRLTGRGGQTAMLRAGFAQGRRVGGLVALAQAGVAAGYARERFSARGAARPAAGSPPP